MILGNKTYVEELNDEITWFEGKISGMYKNLILKNDDCSFAIFADKIFFLFSFLQCHSLIPGP